ncbi:MAG: RNA polymerase sigma factor [Phycisphaerales bacterium]
MQLTDEQMIAAIGRGDEAACRLFIDRFGGRMNGLIISIIGRRSGDCDDVLQRALIKAWKSASAYDPSLSSVAAWSLMIARSVAIDHLRKVRRQDDNVSKMQETMQAEDSESAADTPLLLAEVGDEILRRLPREQLEALTLAFYRGMTHREVAAAQNVPMGTVKTRIKLAIDKLRMLLQKSPASADN